MQKLICTNELHFTLFVQISLISYNFTNLQTNLQKIFATLLLIFTNLQANYANALYGKGICLSEGFDADFMCRLALLGISMAPTHYEEDAYLTDYYIMSNSVLKDLFVDGIKSPSVIRMESAMRKQLEPDEDETSYHRLKCIDEDTIREFLSRRKRYEQEVQDGVESKSMGLR